MSIAAYEQRLQVLEAAVADLRSKQSARETGRTGGPTDDLTPDVDQPLVPAVPPKQRSRLRARLSCVQARPAESRAFPSRMDCVDLGEAENNHDWYELTESEPGRCQEPFLDRKGRFWLDFGHGKTEPSSRCGLVFS